jgi:colicin import membrane protein
MAEHEPDGINEIFASSARVAITAGGLMVERIVRQREQAHRDAQAQSQQAARELQARLDSERRAAATALKPIGRGEWWDRAAPEEIGVAWETANAWRSVDPDAQRTTDLMRDELRRRYAIDVDSLDADPASVQDALERRERGLRLASQARESARVDDVVAAPLLVAAGRADRQQNAHQVVDADPEDHARGEVLYDSAERRRDLAAELEGLADEETIEARVVADTNQALPAEEAVSNTTRRAPTARRSRSKGSQVRSPARRSDRGR